MKITLVVTTSVVLLSSASVYQSAEKLETHKDDTTRLKQMLADDFQKDSRADYTAKGDLLWEKGSLTLAPGSSVARKLNAGSWVELKIGVEFAELKKDPTQTVALQINRKGGNPCMVVLTRTQEQDRVAGHVRILDSFRKGQEGKLQSKLVRNFDTEEDLGSGDWTVNYRHGLLKVCSPKGLVLRGYVDNGSLPLVSVQLRNYGRTIRLTKLAVAGDKPPAALTADERRELTSAYRLSEKASLLASQGNAAQAIVARREAVEIAKRLLGEMHPNYAIGLNNLAEEYRLMGDYAKAEPLYIQALQVKSRVFGEEHPSYAIALNDLAILYQSKGDNAKAVSLYLRARDITKNALGEGHPDYAHSLNCLASIYTSTGNYTKAEQLCLQALDIRRKVLGEEHPDYGQSIRGLAVIYERMGKYAKAEPLYLEALDLFKKALGEEHRYCGTILNHVAGLYQSMGKYAKAEPLYLQALDIKKKVLGDEHPEFATSLNNLGELYKDMGDYAKAERLFLQARDARKKVLGDGHPSFASSLNSLAMLYESTGEYAKAEPLCLRALDIRKRTLGKDHPGYANSLHNLAVLYESMGEYAKTELLYQQALAIRKIALGEEHPRFALNLSNLAVLYASMGDYAKAETLCLRARDIQKRVLGEEHPDYANSLTTLAVLYESIGNYAQAEPLYVQARDIKEDALGKGHPGYALSLNNLAALYNSMGNYEKSESHYLQARDLWKKILGERHANYSLSLNNLAALYKSMGMYRKAELLYLQSLDLVERTLGVDHPRLAISLNNLAALYLTTGDYEKAETLYAKTLNIQFKLTGEVLTSRSEAQALNYLAAKSPPVSGLLSVSSHLNKPKHDAYQFVWQARRVLHRVTAHRNKQLHLVRSEASQETEEHFRDYLRTRRQIGQLILSASETDANKLRKRDELLVKLSDQKESLERRLAAVLPNAAQIFEYEGRQWADLSKHLPPDAVFVDIVRYNAFQQDSEPSKKGGWYWMPSYTGFVLRRGLPVVRIDLGPAKPIDDAARKWREVIANRKPDRETAATLSRLVWQPLAKAFSHGAKTVYLCPDSSLATIPWAAFPTGEGNRIVLEEFAVAVVPHGHFLLSQLSNTSPQRMQGDPSLARRPSEQLLLVGDVSYDKRPSFKKPTEPFLLAQGRTRDALTGNNRLHWPVLSETTTEISEIARLAEQRPLTQLRGNDATSTRVLAELPNVNYVHFATHGFFADKNFRSYLQVGEENFERERDLGLIGNRGTFAGRNPLVLSGLVFAGANLPRRKDEYGIPTDDGGILTAEAIASLPLYDLKLAVLSACETGLGDVAGGEGVYGLQRAFHIAGTQNVIASLWKVDDQATAALMRLFYFKLWNEGKPPIRALRESQLALYHHPEQIKELSSSRGPSFDKIVKVVARQSTELKSSKAPTRLWAAFILSGHGR